MSRSRTEDIKINLKYTESEEVECIHQTKGKSSCGLLCRW